MGSNLGAIAAMLTDSLKLAQPPIAVCLMHDVPAGIKHWAGRVPAGCRFWQEAAGEVFATSPRDHDLCAIGTLTHNLEVTSEHEAESRDALKVFADLSYVREEDIQLIPVVQSRPRFVVYGPLAVIPLKPDVVLLFVKADQALILSEAVQQVERAISPAMGRPACAIIPQAANSGTAALSLGCCGERTYLDILGADVALYAIPGSKLGVYTERIAALAKANAVLRAFHATRRKEVEAGRNPTVLEFLAAIQAGACTTGVI